MKLAQVNNPKAVKVLEMTLRQAGGAPFRSLALFESDTGLKIIHAIETTEHGELRHVSVSHEVRLPTWEEMRDLKYELFEVDEDAVMILPRKKGGPRYVNVHKNCLHLWQLPRIPGRSGKWDLE